MTISPDEARTALATRIAERDLISQNLHELYESIGMRLLSGATLTGATKQKWEAASTDLAAMLETFTAYSEVLDRAGAVLGRGRRPAGPALAEVTTLLTGPSVRLTAAPAPLGRRGLTESAQRDVTLATAVQQMRTAFARVSKVAAQAEAVWNEITGRLGGVDEELAQARQQAAGLADDALTTDLAVAEDGLRALRGLLNSDPLALAQDAQGNQVDTARPDRIRAQVGAVAARVAEVARLRDGIDRRIAEVARAVADAHTAERDAAAARAAAAEKVSAAELPWAGGSPTDLAGPARNGRDLDGRLAAAQGLRSSGQWSRLAAELASIEQAAAAAAERLRAAQREASWLVGRRHELWGLLGAYRAMADRSGGAEDPGLATEYERAERLLHTAPCPLTAATDAVTRYQQAVLTFTGRRH